MSRDVVVLGVGLHPFGRWPGKTTQELVRESATMALDMANVPFKDVQLVTCGRVQPSSGGAFEAISELGMTGVPIITTDMACASSSTALRQACQAIELGVADVALVVGFERMERGLVQANTAGTYKDKLGMGLMPTRYALKAQAYMAPRANVSATRPRSRLSPTCRSRLTRTPRTTRSLITRRSCRSRMCSTHE